MYCALVLPKQQSHHTICKSIQITPPNEWKFVLSARLESKPNLRTWRVDVYNATPVWSEYNCIYIRNLCQHLYTTLCLRPWGKWIKIIQQQKNSSQNTHKTRGTCAGAQHNSFTQDTNAMTRYEIYGIIHISRFARPCTNFKAMFSNGYVYVCLYAHPFNPQLRSLVYAVYKHLTPHVPPS